MKRILGFLFFSIAALLQSAPASARDRTLLNACFAPETLKAVSGEGLVAHGDKRFDKSVAPQIGDAPPPIDQALRGSIRRVELPPGEKLVALTFDLCEQQGEVAGYTGGIFDTLRRENVPATIFAGGKWMRSHQTRSEQLMMDPLFEIASHGDHHRNSRKLDGKELAEELSGPSRVYNSYRDRLTSTQCAAKAEAGADGIPRNLKLFRFPYGACNATSLAAVNDAGMLAIQWDVSSGDPDPHQTANEIIAQVMRNVKPGSIIVSHANGRGWHMDEALPRLITKLREKGYAFATVSDLLARGKPVIATSCYDSKPGDTDRYDFIGQLHARSKNDVSSGGWIPTMSFNSLFPPSEPPTRVTPYDRQKSRILRSPPKVETNDLTQPR